MEMMTDLKQVVFRNRISNSTFEQNICYLTSVFSSKSFFWTLSLYTLARSGYAEILYKPLYKIMKQLIPVAPRGAGMLGGQILVDPNFEYERIGFYCGRVARISIVLDELSSWRLYFASRQSMSRVQLLNSTNVENDDLSFDLIRLLGHELYIPSTDVLILECDGVLTQCVTYLAHDIRSNLDEELEKAMYLIIKNATKVAA